MKLKTEQEKFWAGDFGENYISRNKGHEYLASNIDFFKKILCATQNINTVIELGCNIGLNLQALHEINSKLKLCGYEINESAVKKARELNIASIHHKTVIENIPTNIKYDLSFTKGVLIHINPNELDNVYDNLYNLSNRYILICEYYNPTPVTIEYRGHSERLFKRDFAGELIDKYNLRLVDYGFIYHRDPRHPQDDNTWFLLEKC
ncbi:pseudaminic acid biosynthesis-associated methylase [Aeromonas veronii]|uniref:pseudaminic acid biosynthesis-associated methylase n=2 Tax=Aeromonas veronii TaxID=654 RepID=UPI000F5D61B7|nr:pseudaminic acid biosynthesis-associated methylase [Aeromonas veronii]MBA2080325.1 pseudaminic acid biosynthesis-associated methylase [Aeromonas veronii]RRA92749.1 methyltransferase domain-containing protein [Aeromonas veronii bv. sobria]TNI70794.1 pseudaminic acid biosynthesis-associated methylase [Aeromonas veronii]WIJ42093.1 methyltransferase [Aeromonas veronii]